MNGMSQFRWHSAWSESGHVAGSSQYGNESLGPIKEDLGDQAIKAATIFLRRFSSVELAM
jgi:hypothetical protein